MKFIIGVCLCLALGAQGQLNPLGRFGKCIDVKTISIPSDELEGTWYMQYRPENPDYYVHTGQAQYEEFVKGDLRSLLYFYNKGGMVNAPQNIKYHPTKKPGQFRRGITVDDYSANIYLNLLAYDKDLKYRVVYLCSDNVHANPDIFNVAISTRDILPENIERVKQEATVKLYSISPKFKVDLMKVNQEGIAPLNIKKKKTKKD